MKIPAKIFIFGAALIVLIAAALLIISKTTPGVKENALLKSVDQGAIVKLILTQPTGSVTLEKKDGVWMVTSPLQDLANTGAVEETIKIAKDISVGSVISEKKDRYANFDLDDENANRFQVFQVGKESPALDLYIGKQALSYGSSYVRYPDKEPVYIADNLPNWMLMRSVEEFRDRRVLPISRDDLQKLSVTEGKSTLSLSRSSNTWSVDGSTAPIPDPVLSNFLNRLDSLQAVEFLDPASTTTIKTGFESPYLVISVSSTIKMAKVLVGAKKSVTKGQPDPNQRYVQVEGRSAILVVSTPAVDELLKQIKTLPK